MGILFMTKHKYLYNNKFSDIIQRGGIFNLDGKENKEEKEEEEDIDATIMENIDENRINKNDGNNESICNNNQNIKDFNEMIDAGEFDQIKKKAEESSKKILKYKNYLERGSQNQRDILDKLRLMKVNQKDTFEYYQGLKIYYLLKYDQTFAKNGEYFDIISNEWMTIEQSEKKNTDKKNKREFKRKK